MWCWSSLGIFIATHTGSVLESEEPLPRNASDGCAFINGCNLMPPLLDGAGENPAGASRGGGGGDAVEEFRHNSHSSEITEKIISKFNERKEESFSFCFFSTDKQFFGCFREIITFFFLL